jgi:hypothetical protein
MLPSRGNPFPAGPQGSGVPEGGTGAEPGVMPEPHDLSPDDLAAMFPSSPDERDVPPEEMAPPSMMETPAMGAGAETPALPMTDAAAPAPSPEDLAAMFPTTPEERGAGMGADATEVPPGARVMPEVALTAPGMAVPSTTVVGGQALPGMRAFGSPLQISENVGISGNLYQPAEALPGQNEQVNLLVTDAQLTRMWLEVDSLQDEVAKTAGISKRMAEEILGRLSQARNYLLNARANFEEADREVAHTKYLLARIKRSGKSQHARAIMSYLLVFLVVVVAAFLIRPMRLGPIISGQGTVTENWAWAILFGGIGGVTGSLYGLWTHVARDQDYDPQYALWYYSNPLMGLLLGGFVHFLLLSGVALVSGGEAFTPSPYPVWVLAFAVGFQQNLAFSLLNSALKKMIPQEEQGKRPETAVPGPGAEDGK